MTRATDWSVSGQLQPQNDPLHAAWNYIALSLPLKLFDTRQHRPPLEVLRRLTRTLIGSMLFSGIGGYCSSLNYCSRVY